MFTTDEVLGKLGLQARRSAGDYLFPVLGVFGAGILVGAGVALMLAPKSGALLREDIGRKAMDLKRKVKDAIPTRGDVREFVQGAGEMVEDIISDEDLDTMTREQLYQRAAAQNIPDRSQMSKRELIEALRSH